MDFLHTYIIIILLTQNNKAAKSFLNANFAEDFELNAANIGLTRIRDGIITILW